VDWKLELIVVPVSDVDRAKVSHFESGRQVPGPDPERAAYNSFVSFSDPDGSGWMVQEVRPAESPA
jgi:hypothetical protein